MDKKDVDTSEDVPSDVPASPHSSEDDYIRIPKSDSPMRVPPKLDGRSSRTKYGAVTFLFNILIINFTSLTLKGRDPTASPSTDGPEARVC